VNAGKPLFSVFIPAYNAEHTVQQAIESVLAQTCLDFELIVINDASVDSTASIIDRYRDNPQVRICHNPQNLGVTGNWNKGVELCRGRYVARLDADDFYAPDYLEEIAAMFEHPANPEMVFTGVQLEFANGQNRFELPYRDNWVKSGGAFLPEVVRYCPIRAPSMCVKKSCYQKLGGVRDDLKIHHDWEFWVRLVANCQSVGYIARPLTHYRVLNAGGCTEQAIDNASSPADCEIWLNNLENGTLPYQLTDKQLSLLKQGMVDMVMTFAVFAMERGNTAAVDKHLAFARTLMRQPVANGSMQAWLYTRAAEVYFMEGGHFLKGWRFLLQSLRFGFPFPGDNRHLKLWARAIFGKKIFEMVRNQTVARSRFPYSLEN